MESWLIHSVAQTFKEFWKTWRVAMKSLIKRWHNVLQSSIIVSNLPIHAPMHASEQGEVIIEFGFEGIHALFAHYLLEVQYPLNWTELGHIHVVASHVLRSLEIRRFTVTCYQVVEHRKS